MTCPGCSRRTLNLFIRLFITTETRLYSRTKPSSLSQSFRFLSGGPSSYSFQARAEPPKPFGTNNGRLVSQDEATEKERPAWQVHKEMMKEKLGGAAWNPRKRLSPDTMEGIRHLHSTQPERFTTPVLAQHFKVSPEAIRRILKSKWQPSDAEVDSRLERWDKRGEKIWSNLVELGIKPPKKWRDMGVGRARNGEKPRWKSGARNTVDVYDSAGDEDIIPIVDGTADPKQRRWDNRPLAERLGV